MPRFARRAARADKWAEEAEGLQTAGDSGSAGRPVGTSIVLTGRAGPSLRDPNVLLVLFLYLVVCCSAGLSKANEAQIFILGRGILNAIVIPWQ